MSILRKLSPKIASLSYFDPITGTYDSNVIPYPIGNSSGKTMKPFLNSQNDVIWRNDAIMTSNEVKNGRFTKIVTENREFELF